MAFRIRFCFETFQRIDETNKALIDSSKTLLSPCLLLLTFQPSFLDKFLYPITFWVCFQSTKNMFFKRMYRFHRVGINIPRGWPWDFASILQYIEIAYFFNQHLFLQTWIFSIHVNILNEYIFFNQHMKFCCSQKYFSTRIYFKKHQKYIFY